MEEGERRGGTHQEGRPVTPITMKLSYSVESVVTLDGRGQLHLLDLYSRIKSGEVPHDVAPPGFVAAMSKLPNDASRDLILRTLVGETTSAIIENEIPQFYPPERYGFNVRIAKVAYQETPEALDPPMDAVPQVVMPGNRTTH